MVNDGISGTSVFGLPRLGGSSSRISKEKEVTGIIPDNQIIFNNFNLNQI
jgi:hypothetical protein